MALQTLEGVKIFRVLKSEKVFWYLEEFIIGCKLGFGQGGSGCSGKLAPCMCRETHCTCASSPCIFFFVFHPQMIQILDIKSNNFQKNVEFFEFFGFTLCFRTFQAQKNLNFFPTRLIEKFRFSMIFDYQSEIVKVFRKFFVKGCILKYYLQNMRI